MRLGSIEAGGTKFVCAVGNEKGEILERVSFPTTTPSETLRKVISYFKNKEIEALGIGSFGPINPNKNSKKYGYITTTPKPNWDNYNILGELNKFFDIPMEFDTDVNGAALGEIKWGAAIGLNSALYITVGTGIGAGAVVEGNMVNGLLHPEMGHIYIRRHSEDNYIGKCPYHSDCLEGLASGPAIEERWGIKGEKIEENHKIWEIEAYYLAQALVNYILILSPEKIIMGGGVMKQRQLFPLIRKNVQDMLNGYIGKEEILERIEEYIVPPVLEDNAGICGGVALAMRALNNHNSKV